MTKQRMVDIKKVIKEVLVSGTKEEEFFIIDYDGKVKAQIDGDLVVSGSVAILNQGKADINGLEVSSYRMYGKTIHLLREKVNQGLLSQIRSQGNLFSEHKPLTEKDIKEFARKLEESDSKEA